MSGVDKSYPARYAEMRERSERLQRELPDWLREKEEIDKTFWDVVYYRSNPFGTHEEPFKPYVVAKKSDKHIRELPHVCHIGADVCARLAAESEEEAIGKFWKEYGPIRRMLRK